jgi:hypothetical protein
VGESAQNVVMADFNGDGNADIAVSSFGSLSTNTGGNVRIFLGEGDGTFSPGAVVSVTAPVALFVSDFNLDGKLDLAATDVNDNQILVLLGKGDGTFQNPTSYGVSGGPHSIANPISVGCAPTVLELYGTGLDAATIGGTQVSLAGQAAQVLDVGPQGTYPGLDQINVVLPASLQGAGSVSITLTAGGVTSNAVNISVQ